MRKNKKREFTLQTYIDLSQLIEKNSDNRKENRAFGLRHEELLSSPIALLSEWVEARRHLLPSPRLSESIDRLIFVAMLLLLTVALVFGFFVGAGLLGYSGSEPINLLYFLTAVLFLPIATMFLALFAVFRSRDANNLLVHLSPSYWLERLFLFLPRKNRETLGRISLPPLLINWGVLRRSQEFGLVFSLGLFLSLLWTVSTRDIAFGWSTTLDVSPEEFHAFIGAIALPWREYLPEAVPTLELIEKSRYFRLGGQLDSAMVANAGLLGEWWKFLAMTTLFYAILLRSIFFVFVCFGSRRAFKDAILSINGVNELLRQMQEPIVETSSAMQEESSNETINPKNNLSMSRRKEYASIIGWALDREEIIYQNERLGIKAQRLFEAGGAHSTREDFGVAQRMSGAILVYVKSWEPPLNDFVDFLEILDQTKSGEITINLLGEREKNFLVSSQMREVWEQKIGMVKSAKIRIAV